MGTCNPCKYAKATHKPIRKVNSPSQCKKLGGEVHMGHPC
ncbi:hypothetical protein ID866_9722 [Astraeus odoratus]|nr:hypothetical protein ID866_9722 [Astraeus odoratus]